MKKELETVGNNGLGELLTGHAKKSLKTWLGEIEIIYCSAEQPGSKLIWNTKPLSTVVKPGPTRRFILPVVIGGFDEAAKPNFLFRIGEKVSVPFNPQSKDAQWKTEDSTHKIQLTVVQSGTEYVSGFLEITIPGLSRNDRKPGSTFN